MREAAAMRPGGRTMARSRVLRIGTMAAAGLLAAGCMGGGERVEPRPQAKPEALAVAVRGSGGTLSAARVSTKSGEILILEPDGSVTEMALDSPGGRDAFEVTEADLAALNVNLSLDLSELPPEDPAGVARAKPRQPSAQERALAAFRARTQPALPKLPAGLEVAPEDFVGARVARLSPRGRKDEGPALIEVSAVLRQGVDAELAFAYATCALAGWAAETGTPYARHVRTLQNRKDGKLHLASVFTLSAEPPLGLRVMETGDTVDTCKSHGIPAA